MRGKGKTFFHEKKSFSLPPNPHPFSKKAGYCRSDVAAERKKYLSQPNSRSERFTFAKGKRFTLRSNTSRRIYPALHVGLHTQTNTYACQRQAEIKKLSCPYSRSERFTFAAGKHFTLRSNASRRIYPALHVGLHRKPTHTPASVRRK